MKGINFLSEKKYEYYPASMNVPLERHFCHFIYN
jgi:hypothetical protein